MRWIMIASPLALLSGCAAWSCTEVGCSSLIELELVPYAASAVGATATACRNDVCASAVIMAEPTPMEPVSEPLGELFVVLEAEDGARSARLELAQVAADAALADGDVYRLEIVAADGAELVSETWTVDYETFYPNGPDCPGECLIGRARE